MAGLTASAVKTLAKNAGFPDSELDTAARVAYAESGWNTNTHTVDSDDNSYGLWQINMRGDMGPSRRKQFGISSNDALLDPATNAKAAYSVWKSQGWKGWGAYTNGAWKSAKVDKAMGSNEPVDDSGGGIVDAVKALNPVTGVADSINAASRNFVKGFVSTGGVLIGITVLVLGFFLLMRSQVSVQKIAGVAAKVVK